MQTLLPDNTIKVGIFLAIRWCHLALSFDATFVNLETYIVTLGRQGDHLLEVSSARWAHNMEYVTGDRVD